MEILKELVQVITKNKVRNINVLGNQTTSEKVKDSPRVIEFYDKMLEGAFQTDDEAAQYFFGTTAKNQQYKKLKSEFKNRLVNTAFFIDVGQAKFNDYQKTIYTCWKEITAARLLRTRGANQAAYEILKRVHSHAKRIEHVDLILNSSRSLRNLHVNAFRDIKKRKYYDEIVKTYTNAWIAENLAENRYASLAEIYQNKKSGGKYLAQTAKEYYDELKQYAEIHNVYRIRKYIFDIKIIELMARHSYIETLHVCQEAIAYHQSKSFSSSSAISILYYQMLVCYTNLKNYQEGKIIAAKSLAIQEIGSFNWYKNRELTIILAFHTKEYQEVYNIYHQVIAIKKIKLLPPSIQEIWKVIEAFIHYLIYLDKVKPRLKDKTFTKFRLSKFLNDVPNFSKEKRAMNIPIIILQILFTIGNKKYDQAIDRIEAIEKYCSRHIHKDENFRSNTFIKMLLQIPKGNFHKRAVIRKAERFKQKLKEVPIEVANQTYGVEMIPYEDLWQFALDSLTMKSFMSKRAYK